MGCIQYVFLFITLSTLCYGKTAEDYMNTCMTVPGYTKPKPGPEPSLVGECATWKEKACCHYNTTEPWELEMFRFNWNHCPNHRNLSASCRKYLTREICLNQCSPNLGPWNVMETRRSRHVGLPLCQSTCDDWWNACKDSYTCTKNWFKDFDFTKDDVVCPADSTCKLISQTYTGAKEFCETIWHDSYKVMPDTSSCVVFYFNGTNPNEAVGRKKAEELANGGFGLTTQSSLPSIIALLVWLSLHL